MNRFLPVILRPSGRAAEVLRGEPLTGEPRLESRLRRVATEFGSMIRGGGADAAERGVTILSDRQITQREDAHHCVAVDDR